LTTDDDWIDPFSGYLQVKSSKNKLEN